MSSICEATPASECLLLTMNNVTVNFMSRSWRPSCRLTPGVSRVVLCPQLPSSLCRSRGGRSEVKSGALTTVTLCCACTAGQTTVAHSTPSFPCCPKSAGTWRWTWQVTAGRRTVLLEFSTRFPHTCWTSTESLTVSLQLKKFSIIGHSMGADIAGMVSALYPEMVDALVLLDAYGFLPTDSKEISKVMRRGMDELLQFEKNTEEKKRVYTYEKAVERLSAANPTLSEQSVHILLERGLVRVEGGFVFSRDLRVNFKDIVRVSLEQSLEMQSRIQASVLAVQAEEGYNKIFSEPAQKVFASTLLQCLRDRNHRVVTVPGDHCIHLNNPEIVAPFVSDFLRTHVLSSSTSLKHNL
ncbi:serine hydrolase-like protein isoform X2 [Xiphias gladius]|uniref:serine hydrolase-like protein isoform X2 n=1 Tax=Xiphias gladius TaxID=8245 RepID=UPI001A99061C|nr:serine hydrolase-like protein isoform X2 [Xiphias gladius]